MTSSPTRRSRSSSTAPRPIRTRWSSARAGSTGEPSAAGVSGKGDRRAEAASSADQRRRPGPRRHPRQQRPGHHAIGVGLAAAHRAGKLRPLATFGATRSKAVPDVPTLKELGYDVEYYLWIGIFAPKGGPGDRDDVALRHRQGGDRINSRPRSPMPARNSPISTGRTSRRSGTSTARHRRGGDLDRPAGIDRRRLRHEAGVRKHARASAFG